ncbi:MAG: DUF2330 domain-containing protein [Polyangiales bacterium]
MSRARCRIIAHVVAGLLALSWYRPAQACGGFFCSRTPIDQTAEHIIFTVNGDGTITAYVQIQYQGDRDAFAWVVPVPSVPTLDVFPRLAFQGLDLATQPAYRTYCGARLLAQGGSQVADHGVTVYNQQAVGPFDTVTLGGDSASELVTWLQDNGYRISDAMLPFINFYVNDHMLFLAMKLSPDANVSDIEPVVMTYDGTEPMIPLRLTAVAAKPELGVVAFVLADKRYGPRNYAEITISDDLMHFDERDGRNDYLAVVSREIDRAGGHAFVTEYAHATADLVTQFKNAFVPPANTDAVQANDALIALLGRFAYITRLYTRISPEEMTVDPVFVPASSQVDVSNIHDGTASNPCEPAAPCSMTYCGQHGMCLPVDATTSGCYCDTDTAAMLTPTFGGTPEVYCEPTSVDVLGTGDAGPDPSLCRSVDCGEGTCTLINGNPACQCTPGHVATVSTQDATLVRCVSQTHDALDAGGPSFGGLVSTGGAIDAGVAGADAGNEDGGRRATADAGTGKLVPRGSGCNCHVARGASAPTWTSAVLVAVALRLIRRRRAPARSSSLAAAAR